MAKFGHFFISGLLWIAIWIALAFFGLWLRGKDSAALGAAGAILEYGGVILASLSLWHLIRTARFQSKGMKLAQQDPEEFARLERRYEEVMSGADERPESEA